MPKDAVRVIATVGVAVAAAAAVAKPAQAGTPGSFTAGGWAACPAPITWVADTRLLTSAQAERELRRLTWAFNRWTDATGLKFQYAGTAEATIDPANDAPRSTSPLAERTILITYVPDEGSRMLSPKVYAYASPSLIYPATQEIVSGYVVVRSDLAQQPGKAASQRLRNLYLHELGHVLGLPHSPDAGSIMYPIITDTVALAPQDAVAARSLDKQCQTP